MKLLELLMETPQEDKILIQLAKIINSSVPAPNGRSKKPVKVGSLKQFVDKLPVDARGVIGNRLNNIQLELHDNKDIHNHVMSGETNGVKYDDEKVGSLQGYWQPGDEVGTATPHGTIVLNKDNIGSQTSTSITAHELRHALDDSKSKMKTADSYGYNTPKKKEHQDGAETYLAQPAEINARFVQVLESMTRAIPIVYKLPPEKIKPRLKRALDEALVNRQIAELFPEKEKSRDYKQLVKRAMKFLEQEMAEFEKTLADQGRPKKAIGNW